MLRMLVERQPTQSLNNDGSGEKSNTYMYRTNIDELVQAKAQSGGLGADIHAQAYSCQWL